jgi:hypothetical protein
MRAETIDVGKARRWLVNLQTICAAEMVGQPRLSLARRMATIATAIGQWDAEAHGILSNALLVIAWEQDLGIRQDVTTRRHILLRLIYPNLNRRRISELATVLSKIQRGPKIVSAKTPARKPSKVASAAKLAPTKW